MTNERHHGQWWQNWRTADGRPAAMSGDAFEGRFVRFFEPGGNGQSDAALHDLAVAMTAGPDDPPTPETKKDAEENRGTADDPGIPAAYTYFGQFIDHDLTLDPTSNLRGRPLSESELTSLVNFRTPRFDLDCVYGRGPSDQPYLYEADGLHLVVGRPMSGNPHDEHSVDVPRASNGRAIIGDPRNDENRIVTQLQATMLRFHNAMIDRAIADAGGDTSKVHLADVQQQVRWHYQWVVVHDFLPTIVQRAVLDDIYPNGLDHAPRHAIPFLQASNGQLDRMPVEFSVAAYRFGHSMVRPIYRINETIERRQIFSTATDPAGDLGGMRPIPEDWALDWQCFIDVEQHGAHPIAGDDPVRRVPQFAYKIDTSLVNPLGKLPAVVASNPAVLAERNLLRGHAFSLPTGEKIAAELGVQSLPPEKVWIGKATGSRAERTAITEIGGGVFTGATPLWVYVLAEAWHTSWSSVPRSTPRVDVPVRLGPVGGHLVAETFAALLDSDPTSYRHAAFTPHAALQRNGRFGLAELIRTALTA